MNQQTYLLYNVHESIKSIDLCVVYGDKPHAFILRLVDRSCRLIITRLLYLCMYVCLFALFLFINYTVFYVHMEWMKDTFRQIYNVLMWCYPLSAYCMPIIYAWITLSVIKDGTNNDWECTTIFWIVLYVYVFVDTFQDSVSRLTIKDDKSIFADG